MKKIVLSVSSLVLAVLFSACGGGGSSDSTTVTTSLNGIWVGTQTIDNVSYDLSAIAYDGNVVGYSVDAFSMFAGTYTASGTSFNISDKLFDGYGSLVGTGSVTGTFTERVALNGNFTNSLNQTGTMSASYSSMYEKPSSLSYIATTITGTNTNYTVSSQGNITGVSNGCDITGTVSVPNSNVNVYKINYTLSNCSYSGTYNGLGTILVDVNDNAYFMAGTSNSSRMDFVQQGISKPSSF